MIEVLKQALTDAKRNERHNNVAETRYWLNQYKLIAEQAIAQHPPQRTWQGLTDEDKKQMAKEANYHWEMTAGEYAERIGQLTEAKLKEKNSA